MFPISRNNHKNKRYYNKGALKYSTKKYSNPFFIKKRSRVDFNSQSFAIPRTIKFIMLFLLLALCLTLYFLFYSNYFAIKEIKITGEGKISNETIERMVWEQVDNNFLIFLPQKNIFLFDEERLIKDLENKYFFDYKSIEKKLPDTLIINFREKQYSFVWSEGDKYYYADKDGNIISDANPLEITQKEYPLVSNISEAAIKDKKISVKPETLNYIIDLFDAMKDYSDNFKIERFLVDDEINTVKIDLENGPRVYFNTNEEINKQINKLVIIKNERLKDDFADKIYIDVRIGDSIYYR